jgi:hypothetical protein
MAEVIMDVSGCFGTSLTPKSKSEISSGGVRYFSSSIRQETSGDLRW